MTRGSGERFQFTTGKKCQTRFAGNRPPMPLGARQRVSVRPCVSFYDRDAGG